jgi:hypothetical protein
MIPYGKDYPVAPWIDRDGQPLDDAPELTLDDGEFVAGALPFRPA